MAKLREENHRLREENQALRDEVARLKGHKGKPSIQPSRLSPKKKPRRRRGGRRRSKPPTPLRIDQVEELPATNVPAGSRPLDIVDFDVQELVIRTVTTRYRRRRWLTPEGKVIMADLPRMAKNKPELLRVLDRPELPLHNNLSEGDIREYVKRRKISGGTRSDNGRRCRDTFASLKKTGRKLGIHFWGYVNDRVRHEEKIPPLSDLIKARASARASEANSASQPPRRSRSRVHVPRGARPKAPPSRAGPHDSDSA